MIPDKSTPLFTYCLRGSRSIRAVKALKAMGYTDQDGQAVEAMLTNYGDHTFKEGDKIRIKYLPERQDYPVWIKTY